MSTPAHVVGNKRCVRTKRREEFLEAEIADTPWYERDPGCGGEEAGDGEGECVAVGGAEPLCEQLTQCTAGDRTERPGADADGAKRRADTTLELVGYEALAC